MTACVLKLLGHHSDMLNVSEAYTSRMYETENLNAGMMNMIAYALYSKMSCTFSYTFHKAKWNDKIVMLVLYTRKPTKELKTQTIYKYHYEKSLYNDNLWFKQT